MGQELIRRSRAEKPHPLWSLQVMMDEPDLFPMCTVTSAAPEPGSSASIPIQ